MTKREEFISFIELLLSETDRECPEDVKSYLDAIKESTDNKEILFTDNGKTILKYLQQQPSGIMFKARDIAEGIFSASKVVSGAMRKLVNDGYVEKIGREPVCYSITEKGKNVKFEDENIDTENKGENN